MTKYGQHLPGRQYWWLIPTEVIAALLGGEYVQTKSLVNSIVVGVTNGTVFNAYISDSTEPSSRYA
jgi:hypothetical protein